VPFPGGTKMATTTKSTREAAEALRAKMEEDVGGEEAPVVGSQTVASYLEVWLGDAVQPSVGRRTYQKHVWAVNLHISPGLGSVKLKDLDPRRIQSLYASMARNQYAHETRLAVHVTLRMALKQAVRWGLLRRNPADGRCPARSRHAARG
jgi:integrase